MSVVEGRWLELACFVSNSRLDPREGCVCEDLVKEVDFALLVGGSSSSRQWGKYATCAAFT